MSGYGIPYTVRGWGDEIVTTVAIRREDQLRDFTAVVRAGEGPVILVPTSALTPVDTTPPEPEPGVYFIGKDGEAWQHFADRADEQRWCVVGYQRIYTWEQVWATVGGPGITPRRLVPEPAPVELPWDPHPLDIDDLGKTRTAVRVDGYYVQDENVVGRVGNVVAMTPEDAEEKAAALISAARAAREATP